ncbi:hypothetical protein HBE96_06575 [Clostridium sp. P21]|uniref:Uncharacterized protein n=1 Tax=Clostridium muellerianum TaxID=2716538 RepID=A0A7Y0HN74_9CLOT|nr:hypothetical protein [Clostridium muellerianum]NMM62357.1 hypothetical protein [Clostridium muellerianum]
MKVEKIEKFHKMNTHKQLKQQNSKKKNRGDKEHLSFYDIIELMKHDSYYRHRGAIRQK